MIAVIRAHGGAHTYGQLLAAPPRPFGALVGLQNSTFLYGGGRGGGLASPPHSPAPRKQVRLTPSYKNTAFCIIALHRVHLPRAHLLPLGRSLRGGSLVRYPTLSSRDNTRFRRAAAGLPRRKVPPAQRVSQTAQIVRRPLPCGLVCKRLLERTSPFLLIHHCITPSDARQYHNPKWTIFVRRGAASLPALEGAPHCSPLPNLQGRKSP